MQLIAYCRLSDARKEVSFTFHSLTYSNTTYWRLFEISAKLNFLKLLMLQDACEKLRGEKFRGMLRVVLKYTFFAYTVHYPLTDFKEYYK